MVSFSEAPSTGHGLRRAPESISNYLHLGRLTAAQELFINM